MNYLDNFIVLKIFGIEKQFRYWGREFYAYHMTNSEEDTLLWESLQDRKFRNTAIEVIYKTVLEETVSVLIGIDGVTIFENNTMLLTLAHELSGLGGFEGVLNNWLEDGF